MKRVLLRIALLGLISLAGAAVAAAAWWSATEQGLIRSSLANNTRQLLVLRHVRAGEVQEATRVLDRDVDARAVFLFGMLSEGAVSSGDQALVSCHLESIRKYRAEFPFIHDDAEYGALVAKALAHPVTCSEGSRKAAARTAPPRYF